MIDTETQALYGSAPRTSSTTQQMSRDEIDRALRAHGEVPEFGDGADESLADALARETLPAPEPAQSGIELGPACRW